MSEQELKNFILVYQQKLNEMMAQNIALEAKMMNANQIIDALTKKVNEITAENEKLKTSKSRKPLTKEDGGEF